jgi:hypothetical protein
MIRSTVASSPLLITTPGYSKAMLKARSGRVSSSSSFAKAKDMVRHRARIIDRMKRAFRIAGLLLISFLLHHYSVVSVNDFGKNSNDFLSRNARDYIRKYLSSGIKSPLVPR